MRLFVAKSLFIHIPVDFTVTLIVDQIITDKDVKYYDLMELWKMLNWICRNTVLLHNLMESITHR